MNFRKPVLNALLAASLAFAAGACDSGGVTDTFEPGNYVGGIFVDGYAPSAAGRSLEEPPFEGNSDLYGTARIEVAVDGTISGSLLIGVTPHDSDGPGDYDVEGLADGGAFSFTAGDYEVTGTFTDDGLMEGEVTGPDGQEGVLLSIFAGEEEPEVACGTVGWAINNYTPALDGDYYGYSTAIGYFDGERFGGVFAGENGVGTFEGTAVTAGSEGEADYFDIDDGTIEGLFRVDDDTVVSLSTEIYNEGSDFYINPDGLYMALDFDGIDGDYEFDTDSYTYLTTGDCPD